MARQCPDCGASFDPRGSWQRLCWGCWRAAKDRDLEEDAYQRGYTAGYRAGAASSARRSFNALANERDFVLELVLLCHPDRHPPERFELANSTTARLLDLLKEAKAA